MPRLVEILGQIGLNLGPLQDLQLKQLSRMASESRYPQAEEAPMDRFDTHDSTPALAMAGTVIAFATQTLNAPD